MSSKKSPKVLIIVDGFGYSDSGKYNAISAANAPYWQNLWENNPKTLISTSGMAVGLPEGQMGNSEVGHMTLGAGRVVYQNFTRINKPLQMVISLAIPYFAMLLMARLKTKRPCIFLACYHRAASTATKTISMPCLRWLFSAARKKSIFMLH